ncbi:MAG: hypothetical protein ACO3FP_05110 [Burkholderiales bacterium]
MIKLVDNKEPVQLELDFDGEMESLDGFAQYVKYVMGLDMRTLYNLRDTDAFPLISEIRTAHQKYRAHERILSKRLARDLDCIRVAHWDR